MNFGSPSADLARAAMATSTDVNVVPKKAYDRASAHPVDGCRPHRALAPEVLQLQEAAAAVDILKEAAAVVVAAEAIKEEVAVDVVVAAEEEEEDLHLVGFSAVQVDAVLATNVGFLIASYLTDSLANAAGTDSGLATSVSRKKIGVQCKEM